MRWLTILVLLSSVGVGLVIAGVAINNLVLLFLGLGILYVGFRFATGIESRDPPVVNGE